MDSREKQINKIILNLQKCKKDIKLINSLDKFVAKKTMIGGAKKTNIEIHEINKDLKELINFFENKI